MKSNIDFPGFWQPHPLAPNQTLRVTLPPRRIFLTRTEDECRVAVEDAPEETGNAFAPDAHPPENPAWQRYMLPAEMDRVSVRPVLPDRPLVVRPADTVGLVPGHRTTLFVSLPVWFRVEASTPDNASATLMETPAVALSKSWFGLPESGEPCYALKTRARHRLEELTDTLNRAVCFLQLRNRSGDMMLIERFCLRVPHLSLYAASDGRLWCSDVQADFQGSDAPALVKHRNQAPQHALQATAVAPPRTPAPAHLKDRAFSQVKTFVNRF